MHERSWPILLALAVAWITPVALLYLHGPRVAAAATLAAWAATVIGLYARQVSDG